jgi:pyrroline-5-carboxylate reductase
MLRPRLEAIRDAMSVLIAVNPNFFRSFVIIKKKIHPNALVISIVAVFRFEHVSKRTDHERVVRVMPNPGKFGEGVSWFASREVTADQRSLAQEFLACTGYALCVEIPSHLDQITASRVTGPAYCIFVYRAMIVTASYMGLTAIFGD